MIDGYIEHNYPGGKAGYDKAVADKNGKTDGIRIPFRYTTQTLYGFCLPTLDGDEVSAFGESAIDTFKDLFQETIMNDKVTQYIADIATCWKVIAIATVTAIFLGYLYLLLIRCCGAFIVWFSIILLQVSLIAAGAYVYMQHENYDEGDDYRDWMKYASYVIFGIAGLFLCCICCCWNAIRIGIAVY